MYFDFIIELVCQYDLLLLANNTSTPGSFNFVCRITFYFAFFFLLFHSCSSSFYQFLKLDLCTPLKIEVVLSAEQHCLGSSIVEQYKKGDIWMSDHSTLKHLLR